MKRKIILYVILILLSVSVSAAFAGDYKEYKEYIVKKGDTLSEIAWTLKIPRQKMVEWNPEAGIHSIYPGQKLKYYILPDTIDIINEIHEVIETVVPIIQESNDEIKKIINDKHNGLTQQIGQIEMNLKKRPSKNANIKSTRTRIINLVTLAAALFVVVSIVWVLILLFGKKGNKTKRSKNEVVITINGQKYTYRPQKDLDGRYVSLHFKNGEFLAYKKIEDLKNSIKSSFRKDTDLIKQEMEDGRLVQIK